MKDETPKHILPVIVLAQFAGTSLWFAGNAVVDDLMAELNLLPMFVGFITMAVQSGFIIGTLIFAFLNIADRFSPVKVFLFCAMGGSLANLTTIWSSTFTEVMFARVFTGFFLAGIYPVGMKIASDWHRFGLGKALGYLVGALVIGTAFPHLLKFAGTHWPWRNVFIGTSTLASAGGLLLFFTVKDGPFKKSSSGSRFEYDALIKLFKTRNLRMAAFGYFGHMWELYTFWAFVPVMLGFYLTLQQGVSFSISLWLFLIIAIGGISCAIGGHVSLKKSSRFVALISLTGSAICCVLISIGFSLPPFLFFGLMLCWGIFVIPDSPQFSTLVAQSSKSSYIATALTIVNSIGFALTIVSIQLINLIWSATESPLVFLLILPGPLFGWWAIKRFRYPD